MATKQKAPAAADESQATETATSTGEGVAAETVADGMVTAATALEGGEPAVGPADTVTDPAVEQSTATAAEAPLVQIETTIAIAASTMFGELRDLVKGAQDAGNHAEHAFLNDIEIRLGDLRARLHAVEHDLSEEAHDFVAKLKHLLTP